MHHCRHPLIRSTICCLMSDTAVPYLFFLSHEGISTSFVWEFIFKDLVKTWRCRPMVCLKCCRYNCSCPSNISVKYEVCAAFFSHFRLHSLIVTGSRSPWRGSFMLPCIHTTEGTKSTCLTWVSRLSSPWRSCMSKRCQSCPGKCAV